MKTKSPISLFFVVALFAIGCGKKEAEGPVPKSGVELVAGDIVDLGNEATVADGWYGAEAFKKVFGGLTGGDVKHFVETRSKVFVDIRDQSLSVSPPSPRFDGWSKTAQPSESPKPVENPTILTPFPAPANNPDGKRQAVIGAVNLGAGMWLQGVFDGTPYTVSFRDQSVRVDSTRSGLLMLGAIYSDIFIVEGKVRQVRPALRRTILVHESRHSDCTGGIDDDIVEVARKVKTNDEFKRELPDMRCAHLHVACPARHSLAGIPACDDEQWGAYGVQWLYAKAREDSPVRDSDNWEFYAAVGIDAKSRLSGERREFSAPELKEPDMSHRDKF